MTNFRVVRVSERTQQPTYSDTDEHALDAMVFAIYAFLEEYPDLMDTVISVKYSNTVGMVRKHHNNVMDAINGKVGTNFNGPAPISNDEPGEKYRKVPLGFSQRGGNPGANRLGWGNKKSSQSVWKRPF